MGEDWTSTSLLLVVPDDWEGRQITDMLEGHGLDVTWCTKHLQGVALIDDQDFDLVLADVESDDIDGLEFCRLLLRRHKRQGRGAPAVVLIGREHHRELLATAEEGVADYLIQPFMDEELLWRVRRNLQKNSASWELDDTGSGQERRDLVLGMPDLYRVLQSEVSRGSRCSDPVSVVLIKVQGWPLLAMDHGRTGAQAVEDILVERIHASIRSYDSVFRNRQGVYTVLLPHTDLQGAMGFIRRIDRSMTEIVRSETLAEDELGTIGFEGLFVRIDTHEVPRPEAIQALQACIQEHAATERSEKLLTCLQLRGDQLEVCPEPGEGGGV